MSRREVELMGKLVLVDWVYKREGEYKDDHAKKCWRRTQAVGRPGWVVGQRHLQQGVTHYGYADEGPTWKQTGPATPCLLVAYWPTMRPVMVPLDGWRPAPDTVRPYMSSSIVWPASCRKSLRDEMAHWPRDKAGRWGKKG